MIQMLNREKQIKKGVTDNQEKQALTYHEIKRGIDVIVALLAIVLFAPVFLVTALAIYIEDGAPVFFIQERNGLHGKIFRMYKFRSMCRDAAKIHQSLLAQNELDGPAFKMKDDPRLTRVGKFIRKTSIDELPQLLNILKGEMSIVGPRPLPTYETAELNEYQRQRMNVKPGLTCYWQCSGRNDIPFGEWMEMDMKYIEDESICTDARIMVKTVASVITGKGAC